MNQVPRYLVTGFGRSGSSMLMHCLHVGGMHPLADFTPGDSPPSQHPRHPFGKYEYSGDFLEDWKPGMLIKHLNANTIPLGWNILAVLIRRNPKEMHLPAANERNHPILLQKKRARLHEMHVPFIEVVYQDILDDPIREFSRIKDHGFPIDVKKASAYVFPSLNHRGLL